MAKPEEWLTPERLALLSGWAREGKSVEEIAGAMGVGERVLERWRRREPELAAALSADEEEADYQVENALLKKALGYESVEKKVEVSAKGERKEVETIKQVGPDMSAISLWLKRRRPDRWGDEANVGPRPPNNLNERLAEGGGIDRDAIPELQSAAETDADLVERA